MLNLFRWLLLVAMLGALAFGVTWYVLSLSGVRDARSPDIRSTASEDGRVASESMSDRADTRERIPSPPDLSPAPNGYEAAQSTPENRMSARVQQPRHNEDAPAPAVAELADTGVSPAQVVDNNLQSGNPAGDLAIAGRVLSNTGAVLAGVAVELRHRNARSGQLDDSPSRVYSDRQGDYIFTGLGGGEYQIRSVPYPEHAADMKFVRAGERNADLVLSRVQPVRISGLIADADGVALAGVRIAFPGQTDQPVKTKPDGTYTATTAIHNNLAISIGYELEGYRPVTKMLNGRELPESRDVTLNITLVAAGDLVVHGLITDELGQALANETVRLFSPALQQSHQATSNGDGEFVFRQLVSGDDYFVSVVSPNGFRRYDRGPITVDAGVATLDINLAREATGEVSGNIVNIDGQALPGFAMSLVSSRSPARSLPVVTDETGRFVLSGVPSGKLYFSTTSQPRIEMRGVELDAGVSLDMQIRVDLGPHQVSGQVLDTLRSPLAGARVVLTARIKGESGDTTSHREANTDTSGRFTFSGVGAGHHRLSVAHDGYTPGDLEIDVGTGQAEVTISLGNRVK